MPFVCHELHPTLFDIPMRWKPQRELMVRALRVAFADFSAAHWQGLEKSERCLNNSSLFRPQAAVVVVAVQVLTGPQSGIRHPLTFLCAGTRRLSKAPPGLYLCRFASPPCSSPDWPSERHPTLFDIPSRWDPRTKQQPTGLLFALPSAVPCCSSPDWQQKRAPRWVLFFVMGQPGLEPGTKRL